jgi:hypothetical protein
MTESTPETHEAEVADAGAAHAADRPPTPDEEAAAGRNRLDPSVAANYKDALQTGAKIKGEGEIE